jgi:hypothetical protein
MQLDINLLKNAINTEIESINESYEGKQLPTIDKFEAISRLGTLSALVITMYENVEEQGLKDEIWNLKKPSDLLIEKLFSE